MENGDNIEQAQSPSARETYHGEQNAAVAPKKPASATRSAGRLQRERDHNRFVLRPSTGPPLLYLRLKLR